MTPPKSILLQLIILSTLHNIQLLTGAHPLLHARDPEYPQCAYVGYDTTTSAFLTTNDTTYPTCSTACFSDPTCQSFSFSTTECNLYTVSVYPNVAWNGYSPNNYYDIACEQSAALRSCGVHSNDYRFYSYWYSNTGSLADCVNQCVNVQTDTCRSYAYGNGECYLYDVPTAGNLGGPQSSPYVFYDRACPNPAGGTAVLSSLGSTSTAAASATAAASSEVAASSEAAATTTTTVDGASESSVPSSTAEPTSSDTNSAEPSTTTVYSCN